LLKKHLALPNSNDKLAANQEESPRDRNILKDEKKYYKENLSAIINNEVLFRRKLV